jgi:hypothetical protein
MHNQESAKQANKEKSPPNHPIWAKHRHGSGLGPRSNRPEEGGRGEATPRCGRTQGAPAPLHAQQPPPSTWCLLVAPP